MRTLVLAAVIAAAPVWAKPAPKPAVAPRRPPLVSLDARHQPLARAFAHDAGHPRLLVLASPT